MAKVKNKKKVSSNRVHSKKEKATAKKTLNPFEVHINKEKLRVLGKKQKNDKGLPGISRAKAIKKRKSTLLQEYKQQHKSNKFLDKRIGEKSNIMTEEDKTMARFAAVRVKSHKKKSIFNLADDEVLTHRGQALSEIEKFEDPRSEDEESLEGETGRLGSEFVQEAHFGGGLLKRTGKEGAKTYKDVISELIADSKRRKAEQQKNKEATLELTQKLDSEWKELIPLVSDIKETNEGQSNKPDVDNYDKLMRELKFEARGTVSDRLKSEDEVAKEEREKLELLEQQRLERMTGSIKQDKAKPKHRSADDLDDDQYVEDPEYMLSYNQEGESNVKIDLQMGKKDKETESDDPEKCSDNDEPEDEGAETDSEDNMSDLKASDSESENEDNTGQQIIESNDQPVLNGAEIETSIVSNGIDAQQEIKNDLLKRKEVMDGARKELPYTFPLPGSYDELQKLFENHNSVELSVIIERMIKCNHPSLAEGNRDKLGLLFAYLLQNVNDLFVDCSQTTVLAESFEILKALIPQIYNLAQLNPDNAHYSILEVIKEKHEEFRAKKRNYPGLEVLIFLKLVSILFPTSDFRHQIVTPCFVFMEQLLTKCRVNARRDISYGLFVATLILEYTSMTQRYLPAVINFLSGLLHMAIPKGGVRLIKVLPPFKPVSSLLVLLKDLSLDAFPLQMQSSDLLDEEIDEGYKVRVLYNVLKMLEEFHNNFREYSSNIEIFAPVLRYIELIPTTYYPKSVGRVIEEFIITMTKAVEGKKLNYITMGPTKPKALRLYEPKIVEIYDGRRHKVQSREKAEREKLLHRFKKEKKGALREIRKDRAFLGRVQITQKIQSDKKRKDKVKRIYAEAASQQSELKVFDAKKKRRK